LALLVRKRPSDPKLLAALGVALGLLFVTKYHFYAAVATAVLAMLISDRLASRRNRMGLAKTLAFIMVPSIVLASVQAWILWGSPNPFTLFDPNLDHQEATVASSHGILAIAVYSLRGLGQAFIDFYWNGTTFQSFWGRFGWMDEPLVIVTPQVTEVIQHVIGLLSVVVFVLSFVRLGQTAWRLARIASRRSWRGALSIACSNPLINAYFMFTAIMFCLFAVVRYSYGPQGRDWFPLILPLFLIATHYAPKAIPSRRASNALSTLLIGCLALYCLAGIYYSTPSIMNRYYLNSPVPVRLLGGLPDK
jgi:hypothetical protein